MVLTKQEHKKKSVYQQDMKDQGVGVLNLN